MYHSDRIRLIATAVTQDADGYPVTQETAREVWADRKSAKRDEFYKALAASVAVTAVFCVHGEDYRGEMLLEQGDAPNTKRYKVLRAYQAGLGCVELNCTDLPVDGGH